MATSCFFCFEKHGITERDYDLPLCGNCRKMERFQILLLQQLCLLNAALDEIRESLSDAGDTYMLAEEE